MNRFRMLNGMGMMEMRMMMLPAFGRFAAE